MRFFSPESLEETSAFLANCPSCVIAGGTDVLVDWQMSKQKPDNLVDISHLDALKTIAKDHQELRIGALVTITELERSPLVHQYCPVIFQAATELGCCQVRNQATIGGNICKAAPSADMIPPLLLNEAKVVLFNQGKERTLLLSDFLLGPGKTALAKGELLKEIIVPLPEDGTRAIYHKFCLRKSMDIALVSAGVWLKLEGSVCRDIRIALGAVAPTAIRSAQGERVLRGQTITQELIQKAAEACAAEARPITDVRASKEYRKQIVQVLVSRCLQEIMTETK